jgi:hypothetical protein
MSPGNAILLNGLLQAANREIGAPGVPPMRFVSKVYSLSRFFGRFLGNAQNLDLHGAFARTIQFGQNDGLPVPQH